MKSSISRSCRLALNYAEENPDEVVAALDHKTEAVIRELEAQHQRHRVADKLDMSIHVCHFPPGTGKWPGFGACRR